MGLLETRRLSRFFGGLAAVLDLDLDVSEGLIFGLIGPNGAGKSTAQSMIGGTLRPSYGEVVFAGEAVTGLSPHAHARKGIARVFQENALFSGFTALDNVRVGFHLKSELRVSDLFLKTQARGQREEALRNRAMDLLSFVGLADQALETAVNLPHGRQRLLCLAIALATEPRLLLLDEPLTGMNAVEIREMLHKIRALKDKGMTCILIEHNLRAVMGLCDRIAVLNFGKKIAEGTPEEVVRDPGVLQAYLGTDHDAA